MVEATPGIVPVIKGNGYGFGNARLAAEAARLGVPAVAVGTSDELPVVREHFDGDVLVMSPSYPRCEDDPTGRVVRTVAHLETLRAGGGARVVVEGMTTMRRHGLPADAVASVAGLLGDVRLEGLAFHLPMDRHGGYDPAAEVAGWLERFAAAGRADRRRVGVAPDRRPSSPGCGRGSRRRPSGRGSAPRCGWATGMRWSRRAPSSTCTRWRAASTTATGGGGRCATRTWWW